MNNKWYNVWMKNVVINVTNKSVIIDNNIWKKGC